MFTISSVSNLAALLILCIPHLVTKRIRREQLFRQDVTKGHQTKINMPHVYSRSLQRHEFVPRFVCFAASSKI